MRIRWISQIIQYFHNETGALIRRKKLLHFISRSLCALNQVPDWSIKLIMCLVNDFVVLSFLTFHRFFPGLLRLAGGKMSVSLEDVECTVEDKVQSHLLVGGQHGFCSFPPKQHHLRRETCGAVFCLFYMP